MNDDTPEIDNIEDVVETLVPGLSKEEYEKIRSDALEKAKNTKHSWILKGRGRLSCTSCDIPHTSYIDPHLTLVGVDDSGNPLLKRG